MKNYVAKILYKEAFVNAFAIKNRFCNDKRY